VTIIPIPSGTRDVLPDEMRELRAIGDALRTVFDEHGYGEIATPALEYEEVLALGGAGGRLPAYRVVDDHGAVLTLRSDMTVPIARTVPPHPHPKRPMISTSKIVQKRTISRPRIFASAVLAILGREFVQKRSKMLVEIFGWRAHEMIGQSIRRIIPDSRQVEEDVILASIRAGERVPSFETVRLRHTGAKKHSR